MLNLLRIIADVVILIAIFLFPWWLALVLLATAIFLLNNFYEALFFALLLDGFHGVPHVALHGYNILFLITTGIIMFISIFLKPRLRFYQ